MAGIRVTSNRPAYARDERPPVFAIETIKGFPFIGLQVATSAALLSEANKGRRTPATFFDSWFGDGPGAPLPTPAAAPKPGVGPVVLQAAHRTATYALDEVVWERFFLNAERLFFRAVVRSAAKGGTSATSLADSDWSKAPNVLLQGLPRAVARPLASLSPILARADLPVRIRALMNAATKTPAAVKEPGLVALQDANFAMVAVDLDSYDLGVFESWKEGLTDALDVTRLKPTVMVNAQFFGYGLPHTEGQLVKDHITLLTESGSDDDKKFFIAQRDPTSGSAGTYRIDEGLPKTKEPLARTAIGALGPLLKAGAAPTQHNFGKSIFARDGKFGRAAIAVHAGQRLLLIVVQRDAATVTMKMGELQKLLQRWGVGDAVFNDGSDSESLYVSGAELVRPAYRKNEFMQYALTLLDRARIHRIDVLCIDGTKSPDAATFAAGLKHNADAALRTNYLPRNLTPVLSALPASTSIAAAFVKDVIEARHLATPAEASAVGTIFRAAGSGTNRARLAYVTTHATRHGALFFHPNDDIKRGSREIFNPWTDPVPDWKAGPLWLVLAGCGALGLRYARWVILDKFERAHLSSWHNDIHGTSTVPGLTTSTKALHVVYHPGWRWYEHILRTLPVRGVLGYWWRSPKEPRDVDIAERLTKALREGTSFLEAWERANKGGFMDSPTLWAAMVRKGCEKDTLFDLEREQPAATGDFLYFDAHQRGDPVPTAFATANKIDGSDQRGDVKLKVNVFYEAPGQIQLERELHLTPVAATTLAYDDGVGPAPSTAPKPLPKKKKH